MITGFVNQLRAKLAAYSEMTGKNKLEAIYDALSIAKSVREKEIDLRRVCILLEKENELLRSRSFFKSEAERNAEYYKANAKKIKLRNQELRLIKNRKVAL